MPTGDIGSYAMYITINNLLRSKAHFLRKMRKGYKKICPFPLDESQEEAWCDCFDTFEEAFRSLPKEYGNLWVVFEYVLPNYKPGTKRFENEIHIRADALLISRETVLVLEFKQRSDSFIGLFHQAQKYQNRIARFHVESRYMEVKTLLVLTKANNYQEIVDGVPGCSRDFMGENIVNLMGNSPRQHPSIDQWLHSKFEEKPVIDPLSIIL